MRKWNYILLLKNKVTYSTKYKKVPKFFFGYMIPYSSFYLGQKTCSPLTLSG